MGRNGNNLQLIVEDNNVMYAWSGMTAPEYMFTIAPKGGCEGYAFGSVCLPVRLSACVTQNLLFQLT